MNKEDVRALEALALAGLPEDALIGRLGKIRRHLIHNIEDAKIQIRATFPKKGDIARLAERLYAEVVNKQQLRQDRKALKDAEALLARPYLQTAGPRFDRISERTKHAKLMFGDYIRSAFSADILALMELAVQDCRTYKVHFQDVATNPAISAVVLVQVEGNKGAFEEWFLLYKIPGTSTVKAVVCDACTKVREAWAWQVPPAAMAFAQTHKLKGKRTDFATQELVLVDEDGDEQRFPWRGRPDASV